MKTRYAIFHLDSERGFRGGERQLLYLAGYLRSQGHENTIVCRKDQSLEREALRLGFSVLHLPFLGEMDPISIVRLRRAVSGSKLPVILHAHTAHTAALASLTSRWGGPPWVAHRRVDFNLSGRMSARLKYGSASVVVPVSVAIAGILEKQGLPAKRMRAIHDCIPIGPEEARMAGFSEPLEPLTEPQARRTKGHLGRQWDIPPDSVWIGNIAALVPHKDQATLIRAFKIVRAEIPQARLIVIGGGPLMSELQSLTHQLNVADAVRFTGHQLNPIEWLGALDLFVLSSWGEGMGSVLLEAMACQCPIVATTAGGIPEIIEDRKNGLLVPPRNPEKLAEAILLALRQRDLARQLTKQGLERLEEFRLSRCGRQMEECYNLAMASRLNEHLVR